MVIKQAGRAADNIDPLLKELAELRARVASLEGEIVAGKKREVALEAQISRWESFSKMNPVWFWETDEDLRYTFFSANVIDLAGVPPEWHYGKTREDIGAPDSVSSEAWLEHLKTLKAHEAYRDFIFERKGPDGIQWMCSSGVPFYDENGAFKGYRGIGSDVTESVSTKSRIDILLASIEQLDEMFVIWDKDDRLLVCNERFREINAQVIATTKPGTPIEEHIRAALNRGLYPDARGREEEWFEQRLSRYRNPGPPYEQQRQNGQWILIHEQKVAGGATATISTDVTELKKASRAEREKAAILEITFDTIPDGIQVLNRNLDLTLWNDQLFSILGLDKETVLKADNPRQAFYTMLAERGEYGDGDAAELAADRQHYLVSRTPTQFVRQLSTGVWIEGRGIPIEDGEGYVTVYRDVTERRRLDQMQREFVSTVSHELRTPLTSIYGSLSLIKNSIAEHSVKDAEHLIDIAHKNSERLVGLVNDILDMDKVNAGKMAFRMEPLSISVAVDNAVSLNQSLCEQAGITVSVEKVVPDVIVNGDCDRLEQVLTNLLANAAKYSPPDGVVGIAIRRSKDVVRVTVRDYGPGIPEEYRDKIFERFSRIDSTDARAVAGTGLGLYISKAIVSQHEGTIGFDPAAGGGAAFYFELPVLVD